MFCILKNLQALSASSSQPDPRDWNRAVLPLLDKDETILVSNRLGLHVDIPNYIQEWNVWYKLPDDRIKQP